MDEDSAMIGMNTTEGASLRTYFKMRAVNKIVMFGHSNGVMYPMEKLDRKKMYLSNFNWFARIRPVDPRGPTNNLRKTVPIRRFRFRHWKTVEEEGDSYGNVQCKGTAPFRA